MSPKLNVYRFTVILFFIGLTCYGQGPPPPPPPPVGLVVPIDENIFIMLLAAVALGVWSVVKFNKRKKRFVNSER